MLYKNLMVAYDGSEPSKEAIVVAKDMIGDEESATLHVISIIPVGSIGAGTDATLTPMPGMQQIFPDMSAYEATIENAKTMAMQGINEMIEELLDDVECNIVKETVVAVKPASGIREYAEEKSIDMIVMGRRGLGAIRAMLGSVSYAVLHETNIPVVTVK